MREVLRITNDWSGLVNEESAGDLLASSFEFEDHRTLAFPTADREEFESARRANALRLSPVFASQ